MGRKERRVDGTAERLRIPPRNVPGTSPKRRAAASSTPVSPAAVVPLPPKRRWPKVLAVMTVLAVAGVATVLILVAGSRDRGGAATPDDAINGFIRAADRGDVLGALDLLLPTERDALRESIRKIFEEGQRSGALPAEAEIASLDGLAVALEAAPDLAEPLADDLAALEVSGSVASDVQVAGQNPIGVERRDVRFRIVSQQFDGRWYVSLWASVAENVRVRATRALSWPPAGAPLAVGAPTAIEAASTMLGAIERMSLGELLAVLDPEEAAVLHRVAPWFLEDAQRALDTWLADEGFSIRISDPKFTAITRGPNAIVTLEGVQAAIRTDSLDVAVRENCGIFSSPGRADVRECLSSAEGARDAFSSEVIRLGVPQAVLRAVLLYDDLRVLLDGVEENGVAVRNVGGRWFVRPTGTVLGIATRAMSNADQTGTEAIANDIEALVRVLTGRPATDDPVQPDGATGPTSSETGTVDEYGRYNECFAVGDYDAVVACVNAGLRDGRFPRSIVSGTFLAPECGWKGLRFAPSIARLADYLYVRLASAASACMQDLVKRGLLDASQIPFELVRVQCLRGRNPSRMSSAQSKAYIDCRLGA